MYKSQKKAIPMYLESQNHQLSFTSRVISLSSALGAAPQ